MTEVEIRGQTFVLSEERALYWPAHSLLVVADLHLGKAESFQQQGLLLPSQANYDDLARLDLLANGLDAADVLFLGDLVHTAKGVSSELRSAFADWLKTLRGRCRVVVGNHDRAIAAAWPREWDSVELMDVWEKDGFIFTHEPAQSDSGQFVWSGHVHPMVSLATGADRLRLPCFVISEHQGLVPAFSSLAGGYTVRRKPSDRIFPIADHTVLEL